MKSKRKLVRTVPARETPATKPTSPNDAYDAFIEEMRSTRTPMAILRARYKEIFKVNPPAVSEELIKIKISYHLLVVEGYQKCNVPVPEKVMKNYLASKELNIDGFHSGMASLLKVQKPNNTNQEKEEDMAIKKVVKVLRQGPAPEKAAATAPAKAVKVAKIAKKEKAPRVTVSGVFATVFAENFSKKLSDTDIAKEVNARAKGLGRGHIYTAKNVPVVRRKFNSGLLSGMEGKPKVELEEFEAKK